eukprot:TRINITY_DN294_c1_g1_i1.p1 TRINITY_DN294_c1_g1~~TRINITY_DN294_c1_g1_i1.p1  ORF type:complete len:633 (+),score=174.66 TRINITY_DN294_c1_g1_i1:68-1900(+)
MSRFRQRAAPETTSFEEEKAKGINEVIALLVEGGYFRARISAIDVFDKIAGGLAWAIYSSRESIDVDFKENSNIGHKLRVGENIEKALVSMECPFELQAFQIQGMDTPKLIPVLRWLLKRVAIVRREQEASLYRHSELLFERSFFNKSSPFHETKTLSVPTPHRRYKRKEDEDISNELNHVSSVLLEYGHTYRVNNELDIDALQEDENDQRAKEEARRAQEEQERELRAMEEMLAQMPSIKERSKLSTSAVGGIVAQQSTEIAQFSAAYEARMEELRADALKDDTEMATLQKKKAQLEKRQTALKEEQAKYSELIESQKTAQQQADRLSKDCGKKERRLNRIIDEIRSIEAELAKDPKKKSLFKKLLKALEKIEQIEKDTEAFRQRCAEQQGSWKKKTQKAADRLQRTLEHGENEEELVALRQQLERVKTRMQPIIKEVAAKDREIATHQRKIDNIPTRAELTQYEKRFHELYAQVAWKFEETKQNYNRYNVLTETAGYLSKETDLMKSLESQIKEVMGASKENEMKEALADGINDIVGKIEINKKRVDDEISESKSKLVAKEEEYASLIAVQRSYLQGVKELKEAFSKNEQLVAKHESMTAAIEEAKNS